MRCYKKGASRSAFVQSPSLDDSIEDIRGSSLGFALPRGRRRPRVGLSVACRCTFDRVVDLPCLGRRDQVDSRARRSVEKNSRPPGPP